MKNDDNLAVECSECGSKMSNSDFNMHDCPNIPNRTKVFIPKHELTYLQKIEMWENQRKS